MKTRTLLPAILILILAACASIRNVNTPVQSVELTPDDSLEYKLVVFDPRFSSFLATQPPAEFYSQSYYENWNQQYVTVWNIRHQNPLRYGNFYQTRIDYNSNVDYGLELNYQLYNYFLFVEREYGIRLIRSRK